MPEMPSSRSAVDKLKRVEVQSFLKDLGVDYSEKWTAQELKALLKQTLFSSKDEDGPQRHLKKMASKTKAELMTLAEEIGAATTTHMLKGDVMRAIRHRVRDLSEPVASDNMMFGKYKEMTYHEVLKEHPSYCTWCKEAVRTEDSVNPNLKRFVTWLNSQEATGSGNPSEPPVGTSEPSGRTITKKELEAQAELRKELEELRKQIDAATGESRKDRKTKNSVPMETNIATPAQRSDPAPLKDQLEVLTQRLAKIEKESEQDQASESSWARASQEA